MAQQQDFARTEQLKKEISILSSQLKDLENQKEAKYQEKDLLDKKLNSLIQSAKSLRDKKQQIDSQIIEHKTKRSTLNKELKELFQKLNEMKNSLPKENNNFRESPGKIKKQIEAMQFAIETEGLSFAKEKAQMGKIKLLKAQLGEFEKSGEQYKELAEFKKQLNIKKTEADSSHEQIQKLAVESSNIFKELTLTSEEIAKNKKLKLEIKDILKNFGIKIDDLSSKLADTLKEWADITKSAPPQVPSVPISTIEQLMSKKKLTKEDILALQKQAIRKR